MFWDHSDRSEINLLISWIITSYSDLPAKSTNDYQQFMAMYFIGQVLSICEIIFSFNLLRPWNYGVFRITRKYPHLVGVPIERKQAYNRSAENKILVVNQEGPKDTP